MATVYYVFRHNSLLHRSDRQDIPPLDQQEWESVAAGITPGSLFRSPLEKNVYIAELNEATELPPPYQWLSLRGLVGRDNDCHFRRWGRARQLLHWHLTSRYCGSCGTPTLPLADEAAATCPCCGMQFYPRISPCIIVLVIKGKEILLARSPRFPETMFSTLAGFIEPGESAEDTVHREVFEEVRLEVTGLRYFGSQSWPFPGQLMLGFFADYLAGDITVDGEEICEAHWYHLDRLPQIPGPTTIAGQLIRHYTSVGKNR